MIVFIFLSMSWLHVQGQPVLRQMVRKAQVPAHIKDVWENQVRKTKVIEATEEFKLAGEARPLDWHLAADRSVVAHVDLVSGQIELYPPFQRLNSRDKKTMMMHLSLHSVPALAVVRTSENLMQDLAHLIRENIDARTRSDRQRTRLRLRQWFTKSVRIDDSGQLSLADPAFTLSRPWPIAADE